LNEEKLLSAIDCQNFVFRNIVCSYNQPDIGPISRQQIAGIPFESKYNSQNRAKILKNWYALLE